MLILGGEREDVTRQRHRGTYGGDRNVVYLDSIGVIQVDVFVKMYQMVHFTFRHFIVCKSGLKNENKVL